MDNSEKTWSNVRGYAKLNIFDYNKNNLKLNTYCWNKIDRLPEPFITNSDTNMAWSNKDITNNKYTSK